MSNIEHEILGFLILTPASLESCDELDDSIFTPGNEKTAFAGITKQWEDLRPKEIDIKLLARDTGLSEEWLLRLTEGSYKPDRATFVFRVEELKRRKIGSQMLAIANEEGRRLEKTGEYDSDQIGDLGRLANDLKKKDETTPAFKRLSEIEAREIEWLWNGRIPRGMLTLLVGDPGLGKSFLSTWICARLSVGADLPGDSGQGKVGTSIYLSAEDSAAFTLRPRAARNGVDLSKILVLEEPSYDITEDLKKAHAILDVNPDVSLLVVDPLNSYIGPVDYFKDNAVRAKLRPLVQFAEKNEIAVLAVMHLNKNADQAAIYRVGGSIAFVGIARSVLAVTKDPENPDSGRRILRSVKMNYAKKPNTLAFTIEEDLKLRFEESPVKLADEDSLSPTNGRRGSGGAYALEWLRSFLGNGPVELKDISKASKEAGLSQSALYRAKSRLCVRTKSSGFGKERITTWEIGNVTP